MKRSRGRGRRSGGGNNNPNKHFESNGPDVKIRGSAQQILDKYQQYARDAQSSGDRVNAENYLQHAEHYYRVLATLKPKPKPESENQEGDHQSTEGTGEDSAQPKADGEASEKREHNRGRGRGRNRRDRDEQKTDASESEAKVDSDGDAEEAVVTKPDASDEAPALEDKPKRRRTYKKRAAEPDTGADGDDGVMKTLSRGRKKAAPKADADTSVAEAAEAPVAED